VQERLQKLIAQAGIVSRRGAEEIIKAGEVTVALRIPAWARLATKVPADS
jgi:16S rRNA U516 pseudouridylate synthase RsuA-like enzyme